MHHSFGHPRLVGLSLHVGPLLGAAVVAVVAAIVGASVVGVEVVAVVTATTSVDRSAGIKTVEKKVFF